jgi:hypothetical protein
MPLINRPPENPLTPHSLHHQGHYALSQKKKKVTMPSGNSPRTAGWDGGGRGRGWGGGRRWRGCLRAAMSQCFSGSLELLQSGRLTDGGLASSSIGGRSPSLFSRGSR